MERVATSCVCCGSANLLSLPALLMPFVSHRALGYAPIEILPEWDLKRYGFKSGTTYAPCKSLWCKDCGHFFLDIRFSDREMKNLYSNYRNEEYVNLRDHYEPGYKEKNSSLKQGYNYVPEIEKFISCHLDTTRDFNVLDWGGDTGKNTPFYDTCEDLYIFDISNKTSGGRVKNLNSDQVCQYEYNLIVCSNVLEHIPYPLQTLQNLSEAMGNETILYVELPYEKIVRNFEEGEEFNDTIGSKRHWHEHINFFTTKSVKSLMTAAHLEILEIKKLKISGETTSHVFQVACKRDKKVT